RAAGAPARAAAAAIPEEKAERRRLAEHLIVLRDERSAAERILELDLVVETHVLAARRQRGVERGESLSRPCLGASDPRTNEKASNAPVARDGLELLERKRALRETREIVSPAGFCQAGRAHDAKLRSPIDPRGLDWRRHPSARRRVCGISFARTRRLETGREGEESGEAADSRESRLWARGSWAMGGERHHACGTARDHPRLDSERTRTRKPSSWLAATSSEKISP